MERHTVNFSTIYAGSFDLYKVFDNLLIKDISVHVEERQKPSGKY